MDKRKRNRLITFWVTPEEYDLIDDRMLVTGFKDRSAYLRKRAIDVHLIQVDTTDIFNLVNEVNAIGKNINQIAKVANSNYSVSKEEIEEIRTMIAEINSKVTEVITAYRKIF